MGCLQNVLSPANVRFFVDVSVVRCVVFVIRVVHDLWPPILGFDYPSDYIFML